jgi:hypothetical protein
MTQHSQTAHPHVEVIPAVPAQAPILANLVDLYLHDFSEFRPLEIGDDGRFGYPPPFRLIGPILTGIRSSLR